MTPRETVRASSWTQGTFSRTLSCGREQKTEETLGLIHASGEYGLVRIAGSLPNCRWHVIHILTGHRLTALRTKAQAMAFVQRVRENHPALGTMPKDEVTHDIARDVLALARELAAVEPSAIRIRR